MRFKITVSGSIFLDAMGGDFTVELTDELPHDWENICKEVVAVDDEGEPWVYEKVVGAKVVIDVPVTYGVADMLKRLEMGEVCFLMYVSLVGNEDIPWFHISLHEVKEGEQLYEERGEEIASICMPCDNWLMCDD